MHTLQSQISNNCSQIANSSMTASVNMNIFKFSLKAKPWVKKTEENAENFFFKNFLDFLFVL
jgi:hypothetical protein